MQLSIVFVEFLVDMDLLESIDLHWQQFVMKMFLCFISIKLFQEKCPV